MRFTYEALPGRIVFGAGRRSEIRAEVERLGGTRVFVISDGQAKAIADELAGSLGALVAARWDEVVQHVPVDLADRARAAVADARADLIVTVGGGSSTGLAKAIALTTRLPIVAVPTTYAGSEQTTIYGLTGGRHKQTGRDLVVLPKAVIYDAELTLGLPPGVTGPSACNALAHSVEALWVKEANPVTTALSLEGVRAIAASLPRVMADPGDLDARSQLLYGAYLSGVALATTSAGLHHKITHVLGGTFNLVHADAHSVVLPHAVAFNAPVLPAEMARLAEALGTPGEDPAASLWDLATASNVPTSLRALGLDRDQLAEAAVACGGRDHRQPPTGRRSRAPRLAGARLRRSASDTCRNRRIIVSHESYIVDAVRTPIGRIGGALAGVRPDDLAATSVRALVERSPDLDPSTIDEAYFGDANQAGEDNRNVARMAVLLAGLPTTIPAATVNRLCGSGLEGVIAASRAVSVGDADVVIAGGVESMSRAPWVLQKPAKGYPTGHEQLWSTTLGWRMTNPKMPDEWTVSLGEGAELLADKYSISPRGAGRLRPRVAPTSRRGVGRAGHFAGRDRAGARRSSATSASAPTPRSRSWPRCAPCSAPTAAPSPPATRRP